MGSYASSPFVGHALMARFDRPVEALASIPGQEVLLKSGAGAGCPMNLPSRADLAASPADVRARLSMRSAAGQHSRSAHDSGRAVVAAPAAQEFGTVAIQGIWVSTESPGRLLSLVVLAGIGSGRSVKVAGAPDVEALVAR